MLGERLSAWFGADHGGGSVVKDVLSGKERILPLVGFRRDPCRSISTCHFAALNFVRVAFKHMRRTRGNSSVGMVRWLSAIMERHVLEEMWSPCERLTNERPIGLDEMYHVPLFDGALAHVATRYGPPSMILFKQSLRQMQLHVSPVSAMIVSRNGNTTVCLKLRENLKDVFLVLDFALAPPGHRHGTTLALAISTSLEQTAARMSGVLPVDNHLVTRDRQWQAQLFTSCTICTFTPADGAALLSEAEPLAISESVALLRVMGEADDRGRDLEIERETDGGQNRYRRLSDQPFGSSHREQREQVPSDVGRASTTSRNHAGHAEVQSLGEWSSAGMTESEPKTTLIRYEQTKRHCRIFLPDDESSTSTNAGPSPISSSSDEKACFECVICFDIIPEEEGILLLPCAHGVCKGCLAGHVCSKIEERKFPVFCPLCMVEHENSNPSVVSGALVQRLGVSETQYAIWSELEMAHLYVRVQCRRCDRSTFVDKEDYEQLEELRCPVPGCGHTWCKNCQQSLSQDRPKHSCDGTEELDYLVRQMGWKYCPKCRTPVQKSWGCNHITCANPGCNTHFCYRCGKQITRASIPFLVRTAVNAHFKHCSL